MTQSSLKKTVILVLLSISSATFATAETLQITPANTAATNTMAPQIAPIAANTANKTTNNSTTNNTAATATSATPTPQQPPTITPTPPIIKAKGYILMDANSGFVIAEQNSRQRMAPASLTKLMTMYVVSIALRNGQIHLTDPVPISETAWRTGGSRMFIKVGSTVPVQDLINGIVIVSGNDASVAMAEFVGGNQESFVQSMNKTASAIGMKDTNFTDATGLPDPNHYSTPYDFALLSRAIINNFPEDYKWYSHKWFEYNNIKQYNRNRLLWRDASVDGLKTGHTDDAGFCLVASANRNGMRLISVIMGAPSDSVRAADTQALLNYGYRYFETHKLYAANAPLTQVRVWMGENKRMNLGLMQDLYVTIPKTQYDKLKANLTLNQNLTAPIKKGQAFGSVEVKLNDQVINTLPVVALSDDPVGGIFARLSDQVALLIQRWFKTT
jgi:D-alanyl-D-alanine carboxypeptidase (penicillin-binding protein 5/6)